MELGGAKTHSCESGVAHFRCSNEEECYIKVRNLINFLPKSSIDFLHGK
ncbi:carboxyl transferase domain-containing protein [Bacteroides acidifaciens]|nr:hypothetical protein [Enterocloster clostridioformis]QQR01365.1 hypothetical protein I5Q83_02915 [Enterocloster clostridioformis]